MYIHQANATTYLINYLELQMRAGGEGKSLGQVLCPAYDSELP